MDDHKVRFRRLFYTATVLYVSIHIVASDKISDKKLCADRNCETIISKARTLANHKPLDPVFLPFDRGEIILVTSKSAGSRPDLWGGQLDGKKGYFPRSFVREYKVEVPNPSVEVETEDYVSFEDRIKNQNQAAKKPESQTQNEQNVDSAKKSDTDKDADAATDDGERDPTETADDTELDDTEEDEEDGNDMSDEKTSGEGKAVEPVDETDETESLDEDEDEDGNDDEDFEEEPDETELDETDFIDEKKSDVTESQTDENTASAEIKPISTDPQSTDSTKQNEEKKEGDNTKLMPDDQMDDVESKTGKVDQKEVDFDFIPDFNEDDWLDVDADNKLDNNKDPLATGVNTPSSSQSKPANSYVYDSDIPEFNESDWDMDVTDSNKLTETKTPSEEGTEKVLEAGGTPLEAGTKTPSEAGTGTPSGTEASSVDKQMEMNREEKSIEASPDISLEDAFQEVKRQIQASEDKPVSHPIGTPGTETEPGAPAAADVQNLPTTTEHVFDERLFQEVSDTMKEQISLEENVVEMKQDSGKEIHIEKQSDSLNWEPAEQDAGDGTAGSQVHVLDPAIENVATAETINRNVVEESIKVPSDQGSATPEDKNIAESSVVGNQQINPDSKSSDQGQEQKTQEQITYTEPVVPASKESEQSTIKEQIGSEPLQQILADTQDQVNNSKAKTVVSKPAPEQQTPDQQLTADSEQMNNTSSEGQATMSLVQEKSLPVKEHPPNTPDQNQPPDTPIQEQLPTTPDQNQSPDTPIQEQPPTTSDQNQPPDTPIQEQPPTTPDQNQPPDTPIQEQPPTTPDQNQPPDTPIQEQPPTTPDQNQSPDTPIQEQPPTASDQNQSPDTPIQEQLQAKSVQVQPQATLIQEQHLATSVQEQLPATPFQEQPPAIPDHEQPQSMPIQEQTPSTPIQEQPPATQIQGQQSATPVKEHQTVLQQPDAVPVQQSVAEPVQITEQPFTSTQVDIKPTPSSLGTVFSTDSSMSEQTLTHVHGKEMPGGGIPDPGQTNANSAQSHTATAPVETGVTANNQGQQVSTAAHLSSSLENMAIENAVQATPSSTETPGLETSIEAAQKSEEAGIVIDGTTFPADYFDMESPTVDVGMATQALNQQVHATPTSKIEVKATSAVPSDNGRKQESSTSVLGDAVVNAAVNSAPIPEANIQTQDIEATESVKKATEEKQQMTEQKSIQIAGSMWTSISEDPKDVVTSAMESVNILVSSQSQVENVTVNSDTVRDEVQPSMDQDPYVTVNFLSRKPLSTESGQSRSSFGISGASAESSTPGKTLNDKVEGETVVGQGHMFEGQGQSQNVDSQVSEGQIEKETSQGQGESEASERQGEGHIPVLQDTVSTEQPKTQETITQETVTQPSIDNEVPLPPTVQTLQDDPYGSDPRLTRRIPDEKLDEEPPVTFLQSLEPKMKLLIDVLPPSLQSVLEQEPLGLSPMVTVLVTMVSMFLLVTITCCSCICGGSKKSKKEDPLVVIRDLEEKLFITTKEKENLEDEIQLKDQKLLEMEEDLQSQGVTTGAMETYKLHNDALKKQLATLQQEVRDFKHEVAEKTREIKSNLEQISALEKSKKAQEEKYSKLEKKLQKAQKNVTEKDDELSRSRTQIQSLSDQIQFLETRKQQLDKEAEDWSDRLKESTEQIDQYSAEQRRMQEDLAFKENELEVLRDCFLQLKAFETNEEMKEDADGSSNISEKLSAMMDVSRVNASLKAVEEERNVLQNKCDIEAESRKDLEDQVELLKRKAESMQTDKMKAERQCHEAQTKLTVLTTYFKEKEAELARQLGEQEVLKNQNISKLETSDTMSRQMEQEKETYRMQVEDLKSEISKAERDFRSQIAANEKKAHENWVQTRAAERELKESKLECSMLRQKLTDLERRLVQGPPGLIRPITTRGMPPPGMMNGPPPPPPPGMDRGDRPGSRGSVHGHMTPRLRDDDYRDSPGPDRVPPPDRRMPPGPRPPMSRGMPLDPRSPPPYSMRGPPPLDRRSPPPFNRFPPPRGPRPPFPPNMQPPLRGPPPPRLHSPPLGLPEQHDGRLDQGMSPYSRQHPPPQGPGPQDRVPRQQSQV